MMWALAAAAAFSPNDAGPRQSRLRDAGIYDAAFRVADARQTRPAIGELVQTVLRIDERIPHNVVGTMAFPL